MDIIMLSMKYSSFSILLFFSCHTALDTTSGTMGNRNNSTRCPRFILYLRRKDFNISSVSITLTVGFLKIPFGRLKAFLSIPSLPGFFFSLLECWILSSAFPICWNNLYRFPHFFCILWWITPRLWMQISPASLQSTPLYNDVSSFYTLIDWSY